MRFDSYHPAINLVFFAGAIACAILFDQPVFLGIGYVCAFAYSIALNGRRALAFDLALMPIAALFVMYYVSFNHFGTTVIGHDSIGNALTLESLFFGMSIAIRTATVLMWFSCVHVVVTADKVVYLLGRVSPRLSLMVSIVLRMVPRMKAQAKRIDGAQRALGMSVGQGSLLYRARNALREVSITLTWLFESFATTSDSMRSRGYLLRGRTAYSIYRFDGRDRIVVIFLFACAALVFAGALLDQTSILYSPEIVMNRVTPLSFLFYGAYASFCLTPLVLQVIGKVRFSCSKERCALRETMDEGKDVRGLATL